MTPAAAGEGGTGSICSPWGAGALVVQAPPSYSTSGNWPPDSLLDELLGTGWATLNGDLTPKVFRLLTAYWSIACASMRGFASALHIPE